MIKPFVGDSGIESQNAIFIAGLPVTMDIQELNQQLSNIFGELGQITVIAK